MTSFLLRRIRETIISLILFGGANWLVLAPPGVFDKSTHEITCAGLSSDKVKQMLTNVKQYIHRNKKSRKQAVTENVCMYIHEMLAPWKRIMLLTSPQWPPGGGLTQHTAQACAVSQRFMALTWPWQVDELILVVKVRRDRIDINTKTGWVIQLWITYFPPVCDHLWGLESAEQRLAHRSRSYARNAG